MNKKNAQAVLVGFLGLSALIFCLVFASGLQAQVMKKTPAWWPQPYTVDHNSAEGKLILSTPYYSIEHDLNRGGVLSRIHCTYGQSENLILKPVETLIQIDDPSVTRPYSGPGSLPTFSDINDPSPKVTHIQKDGTELVSIEASLINEKGQDSGVRVKTEYQYRWGYIKIHKEFVFPASPMRIKNLSVFAAVFDPSLSDYGYRNGAAERVYANLWSWRSEIIQWRKLRVGTHFDKFLQTRHLPRYLVFANQGVEGVEWFMGDDLSQWDWQMTGQMGTGFCHVFASRRPRGIAVSIYPVNLYKGSVEVKNSYAFDYYIGIPILMGHAHEPWLNQRVACNGGEWVSEGQIKKWAEDGITNVVLHNDGPTRNGLFWRDGSYPPYPPEEMKKMDHVIALCHKYGIKIVPYFSNHELFPSVEAYKKHGKEWMRIVDDTGTNINWAYGYYMCMKSGWLDFLKFSIDRALKNHAFDGVYFDWNLALYCNNPLHVGKTSNGVSGKKGLGALALSPTGHWDMDELIDLMEWTRRRVGPDGLVLIHNTLVPMFATENFADHVLGMEFGYSPVFESFPKLEELPLEWDFVGARSRGAITYGTIARNAPRRLYQQMALAGIVTGVTPWRANSEAVGVFKLLKKLGPLDQYKFRNWKNKAVSLFDENCASAYYSKPGETDIILVNFHKEDINVLCRVDPRKFPYPIDPTQSIEIYQNGGWQSLQIPDLLKKGSDIRLKAESALLMRIK